MSVVVKNAVSVENNIISALDLKDIVQPITKSTICSLIYLTDHAQSKTVKGAKQVQKLVQITQVYLNHDYTKKVQKLTENPDFVAQPLKGKTRLSGTILQSDKSGDYLLDGKVLRKESATQLALYHNGKEITKEEAEKLELFAPAYYKENTDKTTMGRGTVEEEDDFNIINITLSKIVKIKILGTEYRVL
jgi:hypothetical protein